MTEREYIVSLHRGVDANNFNQDMIASTGSGEIPNRTVDVANARPGSYRNTHYALTDAEAEILRNDPRVYGVEIPPEQRSDIKLIHKATQNTSFDKTTSDAGAFVNWGLRRINDEINQYTGNESPGGYNYTIEGTGIDVVIQDSGIQFGHDEWLSPEGEQRLQRINWYTLSGILGTQPGGFYSDYDGHGTHVAAILAGKTFGWAKDANIYAMKILGLEGPADPGFGIAPTGSFDLIKNWHINKPIEESTGARRPTVVNISWGYAQYFAGITGGEYRGAPWTGTTRDTAKGMVGFYDGTGFLHPIRIPSIDTEIDELIEAGVHVCISAGNSSQKIDIPGGNDYNNYYTSSTYTGPQYYHRGGSPYSENAVIVGNIDSEIHSGGLEQKAANSESGPGVDVYAPGTNIMSASSNTNIYTSASYQFGNFFWKQMNISGTSMSSPQVAGVLSLYLQLNPTATPEETKSFVQRIAKTNQIFDSGLDDDYVNLRSLLGSENRFLFNKFNNANQISVNFPSTETYNLSSSKNQVLEGESVVFTLSTQNVADSTNVPYTIRGVSSADIGGAPLSGNFTITSNTDSITLNITEDFLTEGNETLVIELDNGKAITGCIIVDNSTGAVEPTYRLFADPDTVNENETFTVTLITEFLDNGDTVPYTITGISSEDINDESLTGSFTINNNRADKTFTVTADRTTETNEVFALSLDNSASNITVNINDTSLSPVFELTASVDPVPEGTTLIITLDTENVFDGETFDYTISGVNSDDLNGASLTGTFTVNSNTASELFLITEDITTEGIETFTLSLDNGGASISTDISDASPNRPAGVSRNISVTNNADIAYVINGTDSTGTISGENITINADYGDSIVFNVSASGYPFYLKTEPVTGTDAEIFGIINNGTDSGSITWTPKSIGTFYYQSSNDASMGGQIVIS